MTAPRSRPSSAAELAAEVDRRATSAERRWAWRALPGAAVVALGLGVGASTTVTAGGPGVGARAGGVLGPLALMVLLGALASVRIEVDHGGRRSSAATALGAALVVALSVRTAVTAENATPWPLLAVLGAAWVASTAATELLRLRAARDEPAAAGVRSTRRLGALRHQARETDGQHAAEPG